MFRAFESGASTQKPPLDPEHVTLAAAYADVTAASTTPPPDGESNVRAESGIGGGAQEGGYGCGYSGDAAGASSDPAIGHFRAPNNGWDYPIIAEPWSVQSELVRASPYGSVLLDTLPTPIDIWDTDDADERLKVQFNTAVARKC